MLAITGDQHGEFSAINVWLRHYQRKPFNTLLIAGDAGYVWNPQNIKEQKSIKAIDGLPFDVLVIPGNHENYEVIYQAPLEDYCGGLVYRISEKLRYAQHGHLFHIDGHSIFTFGGAESIDKERRIDRQSWWKEEIPNYADCARAATTLEAYRAQPVSEPLTIVTHTVPEDIIDTLHLSYYEYGKFNDPTSRMLTQIRSLLPTTPVTWFFGHFHRDGIIRQLQNITYKGLYHRIEYF